MYYSSIIALGLLCISPLLAFPFILWDIYKQHKCGLLLFAIFMGTVAFLMPPVGDLYRHTRDYFNYTFYAYPTFLKTLKDDFVVQNISWWLSHHAIPFPVARFFYIIIEYMSLFYIWDDIVKDRYNPMWRFLSFMLLVFGFNFFVAVCGVRHLLGSCVFLLGLYLLYEKRKYLPSLLLLLIVPCVHFWFTSLVVCVLGLYFIPVRISRKSFVFLAAFSVLFGLVVSTFLIKKYMSSHVGYVEGKWGTDYLDSVSSMGWIYYCIKRLWWSPLLYFFLKFDTGSIRYRNVVYLFLWFFLLTFSLATISGRFVDVLVLLLIFYYLKYRDFCSRKCECGILAGAFFFFLCNVYTDRRELFNAKVIDYATICKPLPMILQHDYPKSWTYEHINPDGTIKNRYVYE